MERNEHYVKWRLTKCKDLDKLIKLNHKYDKYFMVSENENSNHHYQGMIKIKTKKMCKSKNIVDNFRRKLKESQDLGGNKDFSVGEITETPEVYIRYLCKGDNEKKEPNVIINNILLETEVTLNHHKYWEINKDLKTTDAHRKYNKIKEYEISQEMLEKLKNADELIWTMKIILYHDSKNLLIPDAYSIKKMVNTYMIKDLNGNEKLNCAYSMALDIFPGYRTL